MSQSGVPDPEDIKDILHTIELYEGDEVCVIHQSSSWRPTWTGPPWTPSSKTSGGRIGSSAGPWMMVRATPSLRASGGS